MLIHWTYFRDQIVINQSFADELVEEIKIKKLTPGNTLLLAAREIKHEPNYILRLQDYHLILVADQYDAQGGAIDVSGQAGNSGEKGKAGAAGYMDQYAGGPGESGTNGMNINLICQQLLDARLLSRGGAGGDGGAGGAGGNGAAGGNGGMLSICYISKPADANLTLDVSGGVGGAGGQGGPGGRKGKPPSLGEGAPGPAGNPGMRGNDGKSNILEVNESDYWSSIRAEIEAQVDLWAQYRLHVGEYYFWAFTPRSPQYSNYLSLAANEFRSALQLTPDNAQASTLLAHINTNQNVRGMARDYDLTPDFRVYEQVVTDYAPIVLGRGNLKLCGNESEAAYPLG